MIPPIIATLIADTKEFTAKMDRAQGKLEELGAAGEASGGKFTKFANTASTAVLGVAAAVGGYALDSAYKYNEALDTLQNQAGLTSTQADQLGKTMMKISDQTGISTTELLKSALSVEQAGYKGKQATDLMRVSAQAAVVTNSSVADTTKAIVAAMDLHIAKGMSVDKLTGILVAGSKNFVGGLQAEEAMLSGRVGVSLANYGLSLKSTIALGAEFAKVGLPSRSVASFASGIGALEKPMTDSKGKVSTYFQTLEKLHLPVDELVRSARTGNVVGILRDINAAAQAGGGPLSQYVNAVFGSGGGSAASVLIKNLGDLQAKITALKGAGPQSLADAFKNASQQLGPQLKIFETNLQNLLIPLGKLLLPKAAQLATWATTVTQYLQAHPPVLHLALDLGALIVGASIVTKLKTLLTPVFETFGGDIAGPLVIVLLGIKQLWQEISNPNQYFLNVYKNSLTNPFNKAIQSVGSWIGDLFGGSKPATSTFTPAYNSGNAGKISLSTKATIKVTR